MPQICLTGGLEENSGNRSEIGARDWTLISQGWNGILRPRPEGPPPLSLQRMAKRARIPCAFRHGETNFHAPVREAMEQLTMSID